MRAAILPRSGGVAHKALPHLASRAHRPLTAAPSPRPRGADDGVAQFTVPPNAPIGDGELLADAVNFMRTRSPCLVISDSGADAAAVVCAAMLAADQGLDATAALAAVEARGRTPSPPSRLTADADCPSLPDQARRGPLPDVTLADLEALANFCATLNTPPAPPRPPPRGPTSPFALPDVVAFPPKKRARSPPSDEEAAAPAHGGGTPKMGFKRAMASQARRHPLVAPHHPSNATPAHARHPQAKADVARALSLEIS